MTQNRTGIYASQISGRLWAPNGAYDALATVNPNGSTGTVTFTGIPSGYRSLQLRMTAFQSTTADVAIKLNSNLGVNRHYVEGLGSGTPTSGRDSGNSGGQYLGTYGLDATYPTSNIIDIPDYTSAKLKVIRVIGGRDNNGSGRIWLTSALYDTTEPVTSITITTSNAFTTASSFSLYGVK